MKARRKKDAMKDPSLAPHLPNHVMMEILIRLPIKTLMAIKCVSKSWLNLVSRDTHFAKLHHHRSQPEILLRPLTGHPGSAKLQLATLQFENNAFPGFKLNLLIDLPDFSVRKDYTVDLKCQNRQQSSLSFANSCNGLVCFRSSTYTTDHLFYAVICNPVTGEFMIVPPRAKSDDMTTQQYCDDRSYGLGFSRKENRYKLLMVSRNRSQKPFVEIRTFENGSWWRNLVNCSSMMCEDYSSAQVYVFLEGKLHFHVHGDINCFDFEDEQFEKVPLPPPSNNGTELDCIGVSGGCLCVSRFESDGRIEIWTMKEYGVKDSWTKAFSVVNNCFSYLPITLMYVGNGEILMFHSGSSTLDLCSSVHSSTINLGSGYRYKQVIAYTPTLLPLKDALAGYGARVWNVRSSRTKDTASTLAIFVEGHHEGSTQEGCDERSILPIKTLMTIKCVSKSWLKLVSRDTPLPILFRSISYHLYI